MQAFYFVFFIIFFIVFCVFSPVQEPISFNCKIQVPFYVLSYGLL